MREWVDDGQTLLSRLAEQGVELTAAFWARVEPDDDWHLYLASPVVKTAGPRPVYEAILNAFGGPPPRPPLTAVDFTAIAVIDSTDPMARDVALMAADFPHQVGRWHRAHMIGGTYVHGLFIYPVPRPVPAGS